MGSLDALHDRFQRNVVFSFEVRIPDAGHGLSEVIGAVTGADGRVGQVQMLGTATGHLVYDLAVFARSDEHMGTCRKAVMDLGDVQLVSAKDLALESHRGGACQTRSRMAIRSNTDLRIVYTPGVARVCKAIQADPTNARDFTAIPNKVAICTNGTAILGLGDIGPLAGMPVMEGKSAIFWEFAGISAEPVLIDTHDPDEFVHVMEKIAVGYGAIQVEDVAAPECFRITRELDKRLDIPVMHDDQYGTATIVLAGLYSALKQTGKEIENMTTAIVGAGAAGTAIADILLKAGAPDVILCDSVGTIYRGRDERMNDEKRALAEWTNKNNVQGSLADAMKGCELFIGVAQPDIVSKEMVESMAADPIVFPLANPVSEISRADAMAAGASVYADGRMMNNALAYPGIFRGALDSGSSVISIEMMQAAAMALAEIVPAGELLPEMMDPATHNAVAAAVVEAAGGAVQTPAWAQN
ncbi:MAG: NAD-dependent malic enzyme [Planctomycetota bacterium]